MHKKKEKKAFIMFKIFFKKAYERVDWDFLHLTLKDFGFPPPTIKLIMKCTMSTTLSLKWNGKKLDNFAPSRGLRQGDPMSPYLFVLCMEKLSLLIQQKVQDSSTWVPVKIAQNAPSISHLFFVGDCLLFTEAKSSQIRLVMEVLEAFCGASGLKVNVHKTHIMTSKHVSTIKVNRFAAISQFQHTRQIGKYMGFPMLTGRVRNSDFNYILEKINSRLAGRKMKLLNRAGRVTLANSVLTTMPVYTMHSSN